MWTIGFACANCPEGFSCDDGLLNVDDMYAPAPALQSGSVSGSEAAPAPQSGSSSGSEPALAPQSGSVSEPAPEVCNGSKQLGECARCRKSSDCEGSFFCCPRMKMCASSSTSCGCLSQHEAGWSPPWSLVSKLTYHAHYLAWYRVVSSAEIYYLAGGFIWGKLVVLGSKSCDL